MSLSSPHDDALSASEPAVVPPEPELEAAQEDAPPPPPLPAGPLVPRVVTREGFDFLSIDGGGVASGASDFRMVGRIGLHPVYAGVAVPSRRTIGIAMLPVCPPGERHTMVDEHGIAAMQSHDGHSTPVQLVMTHTPDAWLTFHLFEPVSHQDLTDDVAARVEWPNTPWDTQVEWMEELQAHASRMHQAIVAPEQARRTRARKMRGEEDEAAPTEAPQDERPSEESTPAQAAHDEESTAEEVVSSSVASAAAPSNEAEPPSPPSRKPEILFEEIVLSRDAHEDPIELGRGPSAIVYRGTWRDKDVAVKSVREDVPLEHVVELERRVVMVQNVDAAQLVRIEGCSTSNGRPIVVMECMAEGELKPYVARQPSIDSISWRQRIAWMVSAVEALRLMNGLDIPHRSLHSMNLLLNRALDLKIANYAVLPTAAATPLADESPSRWTPPELLYSPSFFESLFGTSVIITPGAMDVWSIGWLMVWLTTGLEPLHCLSDAEAVATLRKMDATTLEANMPDMPTSVPVVVYDLIHECLRVDPRQRVSLHYVATTLQRVLDDAPEDVDDATQAFETVASWRAAIHPLVTCSVSLRWTHNKVVQALRARGHDRAALPVVRPPGAIAPDLWRFLHAHLTHPAFSRRPDRSADPALDLASPWVIVGKEADEEAAEEEKTIAEDGGEEKKAEEDEPSVEARADEKQAESMPAKTSTAPAAAAATPSRLAKSARFAAMLNTWQKKAEPIAAEE